MLTLPDLERLGKRDWRTDANGEQPDASRDARKFLGTKCGCGIREGKMRRVLVKEMHPAASPFASVRQSLFPAAPGPAASAFLSL